MKKKLFIIILLIGFIFPIIVNANGTSPSSITYKVVITNKNGFKCRNDLTIPYGSVIEVFEYYFDMDDNDVAVQVYSDYCDDYISYKDFKLYNKDFNIKDYEKEDQEHKVDSFNFSKKVLIIGEKGVKLYKGPSFAYDVIDTIPNGVELSTKYYTENREGISWIYVVYNGKEGWIHLITYNVAYDYSNEEAYIEVSKNGELKKVNEYYKTGGSYEYQGMAYYVKYDGKMHYVDKLINKCDETLELINDVEMYKAIDNESKLISKIKKGTKLKALYTTGDGKGGVYFYVTYNSKKGWIYFDESEYDEVIIGDEDNNDENEELDDNKIKEEISIESFIIKEKEIKADEKLYIDIKIDNKSNLKVDKILVGFKNTRNEDRMIYLNDIETSPYINIDHNLFENGEFDLYFVRLELNDEGKTRLVYYADDIKNKNKYSLKVINDKKIEKEDEQVTEEKKEDQALKQIHEINNKHLIIGIVSAISITITSIILIILINKRMKNKN